VIKVFKLLFVLVVSLIIFPACQKVLEFDTDGVSVGSLKSASTGNCLPVTVNGIFKVDSFLTNNNYVDVQVVVTTAGTFDIKSDTVNGYSFKKTGTVGRGLNTVRLYASGKPLTDGVNNFTITYGSSSCIFSITVYNATTTGGALFTLGGSPGNCSVSSINGSYVAGQAMTAANTVQMTVNVTTPGTYNITGTVLNGIAFNTSGIFVNTGVQSIFLTATGTPIAAGTFNYPVTNSTTSCNFSISVTGTTVTNMDYIPETSFSNWSDRLVGGTASDTTYVQVSPNTKTINSIVYRIFEVKDNGNPVDSFLHRKNAGRYYQLYDGDYGIFDNPFNIDGLILDSSLAVNTTWTITLGANTIGGLPVNVKINCQILAKNSTATVAGNNYNQVIKVKYSYIGNIGLGDVVYALEERLYAKGFGLIYDKFNDVPVTTTTELETTRIQVF
jgi:hypothetical protein